MGFSPIGIFTRPYFQADFAGGGYVIENLFINRPGSNFVGLFGTTANAVITDLGVTNASIKGPSSVGGLVGLARPNSSFINNYATGAVTATAGDVGGLVGSAETSSITASYSTCAVAGSSNYVAGLVGYAVSTTIVASYATGAVKGTGYIGGLVGRTDDNGLFGNRSSITASYATGPVSSGFPSGLVGYAPDSNITASYWGTETSMQSEGFGGDDGTVTGTPTGLISAQMQQQSSFTGFAFVGNPPGDPVSATPWVMGDGSTRPYLYWQDDDGDDIVAYLDDDDDNDGVADTNDAYPLISLVVDGEALLDANCNGIPDGAIPSCDEACISSSGMALDRAPVAVDVYAATLKSTLSEPQSATVVLEGSDVEFDALTYTVVSLPSNDTLSDPNNSDAVVTTGAIAGQILTYTPNTDFSGTDSFTYTVNDGANDSAVVTATITVFDTYRSSARQIGSDIDGDADNDWSGYVVALSSDGSTLALGTPLNDGASTDAGKVRVYVWNGSAWLQQGSDIAGGAPGDYLGTAFYTPDPQS